MNSNFFKFWGKSILPDMESGGADDSGHSKGVGNPLVAGDGDGGGSHQQHHHIFSKNSLCVSLFFTTVLLTGLVLHHAAYPFQLPPISKNIPSSFSREEASLKRTLEKAANKEKTVIITTLNKAWLEPGSIFDLFLESFRIGNQTEKLLKHLMVVAMDPEAYARCQELHSHCYFLVTKGIDFSKQANFMAPDYFQMMWRRTDFLRFVLELGYNFVFTDADIMWFRSPFLHFYADGDFQIACDDYKGNSYDLKNWPNGGFIYAKSSNKTVQFYKYWYASREKYPGLNEQDILNKIKGNQFLRSIGLEIRFLDTVYYGGFCQPSKDLNRVCTMHANCCFGLGNKVHDLKVLLEDWTKFLSLQPNERASTTMSWTVPQKCR